MDLENNHHEPEEQNDTQNGNHAENAQNLVYEHPKAPQE
jgi:hypothetical protein